MTLRLQDRPAAGRRLADLLRHYTGARDVIVLGLPRGGVPVAYEVARALGAPLDVFVVRKLGVPGQEELALGAIASGGIRVLNADVARELRIEDSIIEDLAARERVELDRRERAYRRGRPMPTLRDRTVILVDDGLATGSTMRAAARAVRAQNPRRLVIAVPVADRDVCDSMRDEADEVVCAVTPSPFQAVGRWYTDFEQTTDHAVEVLLERAAKPGAVNRGDDR